MKAAYFPHDYNARTDPKLQQIMMKHGLQGIGAYWCIVEMMYEQGGKLPTNSIQAIAYNLHTTQDMIQSIIFDFDLFVVGEEHFSSKAVQSRIVKKEEISEMKRRAVMTRWNKKEDTNVIQNEYTCNTDVSKTNTDAIQNEYTCNTIYKENKIKENIKEKDKKEKTSSSLPLDEEIEDVKADNTWIDYICMNHQINPAKLFTMLNEFKAECIANGIERHRDIADVKSHINNWLRIQVNNKKKNKRNEDSNTNKRRGYDVADNADYTTTTF